LTLVASGGAGSVPAATARQRGMFLDPFFHHRLYVSVDRQLAA
jgi:hypothetical protein